MTFTMSDLQRACTGYNANYRCFGANDDYDDGRREGVERARRWVIGMSGVVGVANNGGSRGDLVAALAKFNRNRGKGHYAEGFRDGADDFLAWLVDRIIAERGDDATLLAGEAAYNNQFADYQPVNGPRHDSEGYKGSYRQGTEDAIQWVLDRRTPQEWDREDSRDELVDVFSGFDRTKFAAASTGYADGSGDFLTWLVDHILDERVAMESIGQDTRKKPMRQPSRQPQEPTRNYRRVHDIAQALIGGSLDARKGSLAEQIAAQVTAGPRIVVILGEPRNHRWIQEQVIARSTAATLALTPGIPGPGLSQGVIDVQTFHLIAAADEVTIVHDMHDMSPYLRAAAAQAMTSGAEVAMVATPDDPLEGEDER